MDDQGGGPRVVVSTAAFHARVRGSVPGLGGLKETKMFLPHPRVKVSIVGSLRDREVACSASDRQGSNFESCVWRTVSSQSSHYPQEVLLAQFSLYVHKGGLKPDSFHFISWMTNMTHATRDVKGGYYCLTWDLKGECYCLTWDLKGGDPHVLVVSQTRYFSVSVFNPFSPEFTIVIYIHYKPRIAVAILDL